MITSNQEKLAGGFNKKLPDAYRDFITKDIKDLTDVNTFTLLSIPQNYTLRNCKYPQNKLLLIRRLF